MNSNLLFKITLSLPLGVLALITPNVPHILIAFIFIAGDCISAYRLARRVRKAGKARKVKVKSNKLWKAFLTATASAFAIVLAFVIEKYIMVMYTDLYMANWTAIVICAIQTWSILENESSCNDKKWAKQLQKFLVDKAERHFDIDLSGFVGEEKEEKK